MRRSVAFKVLRGLVYRSVWVILYLTHLALVFVAFTSVVGAVLMAIGPGILASNRSGQEFTITQRCLLGLLYGSFGFIFAVSSRELKRWYKSMNPYYPEMQISFRRDRAEPDDRSVRSNLDMYDREIDGVF